MGHVIDRAFGKRQHLEKLATGLSEGLFLVNASGEILCVLQDASRHRRDVGLLAAIEAVIADDSVARVVVDPLASFRGGLQAAIPSSLDHLTDREREVLGLICQGQSDNDMSKTLALSRNTVRNHIAALYRKIGVNRRSAAIIWARERGITSEDALRPRQSRRSA